MKLRRCFGWQYYPLGLLKLAADLAGFAGPMLLHGLVHLIETNGTDVWRGYMYAGLLCVSTLIGSLFNTHYTFKVNKVQVGVRAAVVSTVFEKTLRARIGVTRAKDDGEGEKGEPEGACKDSMPSQTPDSTHKAEQGASSTVTDGQVMNLMSTDCDRVANFCPR